jgi:uncharacterized protein YqhQ
LTRSSPSAPDSRSEPDPRKEIQVGGQAVIEGVVMRGPERWALAVRRPSGDMYITVDPSITLAQRYPRLNRFPLRGIMVLVDSLIIGVKSLSISAGISLEEPDDEREGEVAAGNVGESDEKKKGISSWEVAVALVRAAHGHRQVA